MLCNINRSPGDPKNAPIQLILKYLDYKHILSSMPSDTYDNQNMEHLLAHLEAGTVARRLAETHKNNQSQDTSEALRGVLKQRFSEIKGTHEHGADQQD